MAVDDREDQRRSASVVGRVQRRLKRRALRQQAFELREAPARAACCSAVFASPAASCFFSWFGVAPSTRLGLKVRKRKIEVSRQAPKEKRWSLV
jgi:hypothetical protein